MLGRGPGHQLSPATGCPVRRCLESVQRSTAANPVAVIVPSCAAATYSRLTEWVWLCPVAVRPLRPGFFISSFAPKVGSFFIIPSHSAAQPQRSCSRFPVQNRSVL